MYLKEVQNRHTSKVLKYSSTKINVNGMVPVYWKYDGIKTVVFYNKKVKCKAT